MIKESKLKLLQDESKGRHDSPANNFDTIRMYVQDPKTIILTDIQTELLSRWNYYIGLRLGGNLTTTAIVKSMMDKFNIERSTAYNDMGNAENLFGYSAHLNKRFRIGARIDLLEEKINELLNPVSGNDDGEDVYFGATNLERIATAAKLESILQKYYQDYPELKNTRGPRTVVWNITQNNLKMDGLPTTEDAEKLLDDAINPKP